MKGFPEGRPKGLLYFWKLCLNMMQIVQADSQRENILVLINHEVNHDNSPVFYRNEHKASLSLSRTHKKKKVL